MSSRARPSSSAADLGDVGRVGGEVGAIGGRVVAEALRPGDHPALGLDLLELVEADLVDLGRLERERRPGQDLGPVQGVAVGRRPQAGILAAGGQVVAAQGVEEGLVGRDDLRRERPPGPVPDPPRWRPGPPRTTTDFVGRRLEQPLELGDRPLGHDPGRGQAAGDSLPEQLDVGGHERRVGLQAGDEPLEALGRVGRPGTWRPSAGGSAVRPSGRPAGGRSTRWSSCSICSSHTTRTMSRVIRSSSGWSAAIDLAGGGQGRFDQGPGAQPAGRCWGPRADRRSARRRTSWRWSGSPRGSPPRTGRRAG